MPHLRPQKKRLDIQKGIDYLVSKDDDINNLYRCYGLIKLKPRKDYFKSLVSSIISQQLSNKAASTILGRFIDIFGKDNFPRPDEIVNTPKHWIRKAGLSKMKTSYVIGLSEAILSGKIQLEQLPLKSDDQVRDDLTKLKGIGIWTADMFLIFALNRSDIFPLNDLGIQKGFARLLGLKKLSKPQFMESYSDAWKPYRTVASLYLWKIVDDPGRFEPIRPNKISSHDK
jgi:DNA-3-methyladenine glycosylase II|tara:strand:+ start:83 stop:766 length:684 start_codon:yes stop_codon:yes gene_type:complete